MDSIFILKLILSFFIAGFWAILTTVMAEKYGTKMGGVLAGFPSTTLLALFFIGWTESTADASQAAILAPIGIGLNAFFVLIYVYFVKYKFSLALIASLIWLLLCSSFLYIIKFNNIYISVAVYFVSVLIVYLIIEKKFKIKSVTSKKINYNSSIIIFRGLLGGTIVLLAVIMNKIGGPILGGIFSAFPAMWFSTLIITYFSAGREFSAAIMKASIIGAFTSVLYAVTVHYLYQPWGLWLGTFFGIIMALLSATCVYNFVLKKLS